MLERRAKALWERGKEREQREERRGQKVGVENKPRTNSKAPTDDPLYRLSARRANDVNSRKMRGCQRSSQLDKMQNAERRIHGRCRLDVHSVPLTPTDINGLPWSRTSATPLVRFDSIRICARQPRSSLEFMPSCLSLERAIGQWKTCRWNVPLLVLG